MPSVLNHSFHDPLWLAALALLPMLVWLRGRRSVDVWFVPFAAAWHRPSLANPARLPAGLALVGLGLLVVALARPQKVEDRKETRTQGYDLMLSIDLSGSMLSEDFEKNGEALNRLQVIKPVIQAFINDRPNDRIGIVVFSGRAYTLAPLTFDHEWLLRQVDRLRIGMIEDGTAIGDGLGIALTRLEQSDRAQNGQRMGAFVVLLTDGANNRGALSPTQAADIARARAIPVYTIGAGRDGIVRVPVFDEAGNKVSYQRRQSDLDESTLRFIASQTGGRYFRAMDVRTVENAFKSIDQAKKIEFQSRSYLVTTELFHWPAIPGALCLLTGALLSRGLFSRRQLRRAAATSAREPADRGARVPASAPASP